jgi:L-cystine uptake protein TcyP (sodium:dicarboxylate symporter family)
VLLVVIIGLTWLFVTSSQHMKSLSKKMRTGLKVGACLGTTFDEMVWAKVKRDNDIEHSFLQSCVDFGFLQVVGSDKYIWGKQILPILQIE